MRCAALLLLLLAGCRLEGDPPASLVEYYGGRCAEIGMRAIVKNGAIHCVRSARHRRAVVHAMLGARADAAVAELSAAALARRWARM
jgi:hypothetical protein